MQGSFKRWSSLTLILLQILTYHSVFSNESKTIIDNEKKEIAKNVLGNKELHNNFSHSFGLAIEKSYYHYIEPDVYQSFINEEDRRMGAIWVRWKGNTWGASAFYRLTWKEKLFIKPEVRLLYGKHQYNFGAKEEVFGKTKHAIPSLIFEPRLTMGWNVQTNKNLIISPYSGIAYRFKSDDSDDVKMSRTGKNLGFYRKSNYVYVPLGIATEYLLNNTWSIFLKGEYDWIVKAWHYSRTLTSGSKIFKQPNGYGLKGEISISYLYNKTKFSLSPYINYWNFRNSKEKDGGSMEPYNTTWETGLKLGVTF